MKCSRGRACVRLSFWATLAVLEPFVVLAAAICCVSLVNTCVYAFVQHFVRVRSDVGYYHMQRVEEHISLVMQGVLCARAACARARVAHLLVRGLSGRVTLWGVRTIPRRTRASRGPRGLYTTCNVAKMLSLTHSLIQSLT